jgi:hypothetical protein
VGRDSYHVAASYDEPDVLSGEDAVQTTRWWPINPEWTKDQIVQTLFKCVLTSHEHRVREHFLYKGRPVFGPHFELDKLWEIAPSNYQAAMK